MDIKIIDCSIFYNEINILLYRLKTYYNYINKFIIVEAKQTHSGHNKDLNFIKNKHLYEPYMDKIIYITIELPHIFNNEKLILDQVNINENYQRNYIKHEINKLTWLTHKDIIMVSDIDEIIDIERLKDIKEERLVIENGIYNLEQDMYYYNLNTKTPDKWRQSKLFNFYTYFVYIFCQNYDLTFVRLHANKIKNSVNRSLQRAGWHFSYFAPPSIIKLKIETFLHQELNLPEFTNEDNIKKRIENCEDLYNRSYVKWNFIKIEDNDYLPSNYEELEKCYKD
jgi:beta-1,4-mannosyl-glycoprotein beta-1,4-N-acetylglucosaminyltransferase